MSASGADELGRGPVPEGFVATRLALHSLAEQVVSPARAAVTGRIGLRALGDGRWGTPEFGEGVQVWVDGVELVVVEGGPERRAPITTLRAARELLGDVAGGAPWERTDGAVGDPDAALAVDPLAARFLGAWYGFAAGVLDELRSGASEALEPSLIQLWPEHFDMAVELGSEAEGRRAAYGLSPGDPDHDEPYAYVAPWVAPPEGELWRASGFRGAELSYHELARAGDPAALALEFMRVRLGSLTA